MQATVLVTDAKNRHRTLQGSGYLTPGPAFIQGV